MSFAEKIHQMSDLEKEIRRMVDSLKTDLATAVGNQPFHGEMINDGSDGGPIVGIVKFSHLAKSESWSPEYHFPAAQASAVSRRLESCKTPSSVCAAVKDMIAKKRVKTGDGNSFVSLNEDTLKVLRESEIGQYVSLYENGN